MAENRDDRNGTHGKQSERHVQNNLRILGFLAHADFMAKL
jgi:hypothetical protein